MFGHPVSPLGAMFPVPFVPPPRPAAVAEVPYWVPADWVNWWCHCYVGPADLPPAIVEVRPEPTTDRWGRELKILV